MLSMMDRVLRTIRRFELGIAMFFVASMSLLLVVQVTLRVAARSSIPWIEEYCILAFVWATFLGGSIAYKNFEHLVIDVTPKFSSEGLNRAIETAGHLFIGAIALLVVIASLRVIPRESQIMSFSLPVAVPRSAFFSVPTAAAFASIALTSVVFAAEAATGKRRVPHHDGAGLI